MKQVDVIIPCYKYGKYLTDCVPSVLSQQHVCVRALILDDASPDDSADIACELARGDDRLEFRRHKENRGHIATYNEGIEWAKGDYLILLSADDVLAPGALARAVRVMESDAEVGFTYGRHLAFQDRPPSIEEGPLADCVPWTKLTYQQLLECSCSLGAPPMGSATMIVRTCVQKKVGGYRSELPHSGGIEMRLRLAHHGAVGCIEAMQGFQRVHSKSMSTGYQPVWKILQKIEAFEMHFSEYGDKTVGRDQLRHALAEALTQEAFWDAHHAFERGDVHSCRQSLQFAIDRDPALKRCRSYSRLCWKLFLGPRLWAFLRPMTRVFGRKQRR